MDARLAPPLRLDEDHRYFLGNEELWGVSAVLRDNRLIEDFGFDETSRSRGTVVHKILADLARGIEFDAEFLDPDLRGYVQSGVLWIEYLRSDPDFSVLGVEIMRHHPLYKYAGTMDLFAHWQGYDWVFDYKTGKASKITRFQLGAYCSLLPPTTKGLPYKKAAIELQQDGSRARPVFYNNSENFHDGNRFLSYLNTSRDRRIYGPKEKI